MKAFRAHCCGSLFLLTTLTVSTGAHAASADLLSREVCKQAVPHVTRAFAGVLAPVQREGYCIAGDLNGDGKPDVLMVVKVLSGKVPVASGIKTIYPFSDQSADHGRFQFLALHSTASSTASDWAHYDKLLLDGASPILVLSRQDGASDMQRITPRSKEVRELALAPRLMRGDAVYLGTEAVSAILYWNGRAYVFHEDPAGP